MLALNQTSLPRVATKRLTRRKTCDTKEAPKLRAREKSLSVVSYRQKGRRPQCYTRAGRARARARARAKYPGHFRPAKKRPHQWIFEFFLRDWLELDEILPIIATKTKNSKKICEKKFVSKSPFQGLEPLPQILNKLGRNKKLNPSSRNAKGKAWFLCKIVGTAYFQTRKWPLCYRLIPDTTTPPGSSGPSTPKQKRYFSGLILHLHGTQSCILNKKRTKYNLEKQRSSPNWPVIMTPSRSSRRY